MKAYRVVNEIRVHSGISLSMKQRERIERSMYKASSNVKGAAKMAKRVDKRSLRIFWKFEFATKEGRDNCKRCANTLCYRAELMKIKLNFNVYKRFFNQIRSAMDVADCKARAQAIYDSVLRVKSKV